MKRFIGIFLILFTLLSLVGCGLLRDDSDTAEQTEETCTSAFSATETVQGTIAETVPVIATETSETEPPVTTAAETTPAPSSASEPAQDPATGYKPSVMMYHLIRDDTYGPYENLFVRPSEFEEQLSMIDSYGMEYLFADEWRVTSSPSVIITLDDGYEDNYTEMFPILKKHGAKATVFVVSGLIGTEGYMTEAQIKEMSDSGYVSIQCHTANHNDLSYMTEESLRTDFTECVGILEGITGKKITAIAYPAGSYNDTVLAVAGEFFTFAYTTKSPYVVTDYTSLTIPRYAVPRGCTGYSSFLQ